MITLAEATELVRRHLDEVAARHVPDGIVLLEASTLTRPYGWVFFHNSKAYLETGDVLDLLGGNSPIVVEASTSKMTYLGTALPFS